MSEQFSSLNLKPMFCTVGVYWFDLNWLSAKVADLHKLYGLFPLHEFVLSAND